MDIFEKAIDSSAFLAACFISAAVIFGSAMVAESAAKDKASQKTNQETAEVAVCSIIRKHFQEP